MLTCYVHCHFVYGGFYFYKGGSEGIDPHRCTSRLHVGDRGVLFVVCHQVAMLKTCPRTIVRNSLLKEVVGNQSKYPDPIYLLANLLPYSHLRVTCLPI